MSMTINCKVPAVITQEGAVFVAECPVLNVFSQGSTIVEAKKNLAEAVGLFIGTCIEMGTFSQVLKECGFSQQTDMTDDYNSDLEQIEVPLSFIASLQLHGNSGFIGV